jgi:hypothetical protein
VVSYERQAYLNVSANLSAKKKADALARKEREFRDLILKAYRAEPLPDTGFFHGKNAGRLVVVGPINLPVGRLFVEEVITECRKRGASRADVLAFEFEMGLFPAVLEEAKHKGIDLTPKTIPPEVFDRRAVEKGQVRFHDVAYIEVTPRFDKKNPLALAVELTDFSVYYSQGIADAIAADLKEGKSEVVCEQGKLIKISKDKQGVVSRDILTKKWTDWVDYWAVDFDYESRKEIIKVPRRMGVEGELPDVVKDEGEFIDFEERWTGAYIFENEWQSFRTRQDRELELESAPHIYPRPGRYTVAVKVIDIFGNDTMTLIPVTIGGAHVDPHANGQTPKRAVLPEPAKPDVAHAHHSSGESQPASASATKPARSQSTTTLNGSAELPLDINDTEREGILRQIREIFSSGPARDRETAMRELADAMGYQRLGPVIRDVLHRDILTAVRRGILQNNGGELSLLSRSIEEYDREFLKEQFLASIGRKWTDRDEACRAFARWLGFARTGPVIEQTARSLMNGLLREDRLEADGQSMIRRAD